jgi:hypothetical protein
MEPMKRFIAVLLTLVAMVELCLGNSRLKAQQPELATAKVPSGNPEGSFLPQTHKVCLVEPKPNTRTVYAAKSEEYCLPRPISLLSLLGGKCACDDGRCQMKVRHRLIVKQIDDCDTQQCVLREVPVAPCASVSPTAKSIGSALAIPNSPVPTSPVLATPRP